MDKKMQEKRGKEPLGILILGSINLFIFGILFLLISISAYINITPKDFEAVKTALQQQNIQGITTISQFKAASVVQIIISAIFIISGRGILLKKEWGRKITIYFSFGWVALMFLFFILHPTLISYLFLQVIYPGALALYFTKKNVMKYFSGSKNVIPKE